jgi:hypothetical protein
VYMLSNDPGVFPKSVTVNNCVGSTVKRKPQFGLRTRAILSQEVPPPRWGVGAPWMEPVTIVR